MPLSDQVRRELAAIDPQRDCDRLAELSGLFHTAGSLHLRGHGDFSVHLDVAESAMARRAFGLLRAFGVEAEIRTYRRHAFEGATRYQIHVPGRRAAAPRARPSRRAVARARAARVAAQAGRRERPAAGAPTSAAASSAPGR